MGLRISTPPQSISVLARFGALVSTVYVEVPDIFVVNRGVMFREIICKVVHARGPVDMVLALVDTVL